MMPRRRLPPALVALLLQLAAWLPLLPLLALAWPMAALVLMQGAAAWGLSRGFGLPIWWQAINAAFFPLAWLVVQADIDPLWFLAAFALLALTSLGSLRTRVPLYLSSQRAVEAVADLAPAGARVIDLGCGLGGWLAGLKALRPDLSLAGVEMAPLNWLVSRLRLAGQAEVRLGSLWDRDLSGYDIVYAYLSPAPMAELWDKVAREMRPGSLLISNTFAVPGQAPDQTIELHDLSHARLLIWRR
jgi:SAM-dependent methyltransferase